MTLDDVEQLETARCRAMTEADVATFDRLFDGELRWVHASGGSDTKASMLAQYRDGSMRVYSLHRFDTDARIFGDTAVVSGTVRMDAAAGGIRKEVHSRYQGVWSAHDGAPRLVSWLSARAG